MFFTLESIILQKRVVHPWKRLPVEGNQSTVHGFKIAWSKHRATVYSDKKEKNIGACLFEHLFCSYSSVMYHAIGELSG